MSRCNVVSIKLGKFLIYSSNRSDREATTHHFLKLNHTCCIGFSIPLIKRISIFDVGIKNCESKYEKISCDKDEVAETRTEADEIGISIIHFVIPFI